MSVNDAFVMNEWQREQHADQRSHGDVSG
jgi:peroxiredoxin